MRLRIFYLIFFGFSAHFLVAQNNVTINEETAITRMMELYVGGIKVPPSTNPNTSPDIQVIDGFRIQLMATTDRRKVDDTQAQFSGLYPGVFTTWSQAKPYYRVRVGAFSSRSDASSFLNKIKKDYPDAYIVPDRVKTSEMMNN